MSAQENPLEREDALYELALQLGSFETAELAELAELGVADVESILRKAPARYERVAGCDGQPRSWRTLDSTDPPGGLVAGQTATEPREAERALHEAEVAIREVEGGAIQDESARMDAIQTAEHHTGLSRALLDAANPADLEPQRRTLQRLQRRLKNVRVQKCPDDGSDIYAAMRDWTVPLAQPVAPCSSQVNLAAVVDEAMSLADRQAAAQGAVFVPARALLANGLPSEREREALSADLGDSIRRHALAGKVFRVVALGFTAAILGVGYVADAMVAAITTPAFRRAADRGALRMAYAGIANLARPGGVEPIVASEGCAYLLRRARPGQDEMELLAPAALQASGREGAAPMLLIAQWLSWERSREPADSELSRLGAVARNLGCSLAAYGFDPLERGLDDMQNDETGVGLVTHLSDVRNNALAMHALRPGAAQRPESENELWVRELNEPEQRGNDRQYAAQARESVSRVAGRTALSYLTLRPDSMVAEAINRTMDRRLLDPTQMGGPFTSKLRGRRDGRV